MNIKDRLKAFIDHLGMEVRAFEISAGLSNGFVNNAGNTIREASLQKIAEKYPQLNKFWLVTGEGPMLKRLTTIEAIPRIVMPDPAEFDDTDHKFAYSDEGVIAMRVKIVPAKAQLGYLRGFADPEWFDSFDYEIIPVEKEARGTYLGFETVGRSMVNLTTDWWADKSIFPNRIAIGRELQRDKWRDKLHINSNDAWIIVHKTDGILLKEIIDHDTSTGLITLHSWNPDKSVPEYQDKVFHLDDVAQLFNVLKVVDSRR